MRSPFLLLGACCAFSGVGFGAFGAHALKASLTPEMLSIYQTGVTYQMWHALGLIVISLLLAQDAQARLLEWAGWLMFSGIVIFSGSLYVLAIANLRWPGMLTPLGGMAFLSAWLLVIIHAAKKQPL